MIFILANTQIKSHQQILRNILNELLNNLYNELNDMAKEQKYETDKKESSQTCEYIKDWLIKINKTSSKVLDEQQKSYSSIFEIDDIIYRWQICIKL